jgi:hypothetical protein
MCRVPLAYLGRYRVAQSNDQAVVLSWTEPPDDTQRRLVQAQDGGTWVLYESLTQDSHDVFEGLSPEQVQAVFPVERHQQMGLAPPPERYDNLLQRYARDGTAAQPTERPEQVWMRVKFLKEYSIENVDVSVEGELPPADRPFTPGGQAQVARLMLDKEQDKSKLMPGDEALLPLQEAEPLVDQGICERLEAVYLRDLRDYEYFFSAAHEAVVKLHDQIGVAERENASLVTSNDQLRAQIAGYEEERTLLEQDLGGFRQELEQLSRYYGALQRRFEHLRSEINRLHLANTRAASTAGGAATLPQRALTPVASTSSLPPR